MFISAYNAVDNMLENCDRTPSTDNAHTYYINTRNPSWVLFTHLEKHPESSSLFPLPSVEDYYFIIPIQQLPSIGWYAQDKLARLK